MNLAVAVTQADRTVVLGCGQAGHGSTRWPRPTVPGLTSVLVGEAELDEALERHEEVDLAILCPSPPPTDPSEPLSSPRTTALVEALRGTYDAVSLDCRLCCR